MDEAFMDEIEQSEGDRAAEGLLAAIGRTIKGLETGTHVDPMQCDLCEKITDLLEAEHRWKTRKTEFGNTIKTTTPEWQCKHCKAWNEP